MSHKPDTFFPSDPKKIRERIKRYERAFRSPHHDDGAGKRFLLGPLYLLLEDHAGALISYQWYETTFPDDIPEAFNHLCWVLALLRSGKQADAVVKFHELVFSNLYLIPILLDLPAPIYPFQHHSNLEERSYISSGPADELFKIVTEDEKKWIELKWKDPNLQEKIARFVAIGTRLSDLRPGPERSLLVSEKYEISRPQWPLTNEENNVFDLSTRRKNSNRKNHLD